VTAAIPLMISFNIAWLYVLLALNGITTQFLQSAHESALLEIAADEERASANTLLSISSFGSVAVGFALAGAIASSMPIEWAFYVNALTFSFWHYSFF